jgi:hypothetical protein
MSALPGDVAVLLAALRDALDVPQPHWDADSERAHHYILTGRARVAQIALDGILGDGHDLAASAAWLAGRTADMPVTYRVWVPEQAEQDGGRPS